MTTNDGGKTATCSVTVKAKTILVKGVSLDSSSLSLTEGETATLTATVSPSNATDKTVTWSSNNTAVATVSASGVVTAKSAGSATITVTTTDGGKTATCSVTVKAKVVSVTSVILDKTLLSLTEGESATLTATVSPSNATDKSVSWSSNNTAVATVSSSGVVTAKSAGSATITVTTTDGGKTATCSVTVKAKTIPVTGVSLDSSSLSLTEGETATLTATVSPSNATDKSVTWSSNNTAVATVSTFGVVTANSAGSATITVTTNDGGKTATCSVTVKAKIIAVTSVVLNKTELVLSENESCILTATVTPSDATDKTVSWTSSDASVVSVDSNGNVRANREGSAVIIATAGGIQSTCNVTVYSLSNITIKTPLTFAIQSDGTITWKLTSNVGMSTTIEYRLNNSDWKCINSTYSGASISVYKGDLVSFRGDNTTYYNEKPSSSTIDHNYFGGTASYIAFGNVMSLFSSNNYWNLNAIPSVSALHGLFGSSYGLSSAKNLLLPATTLTAGCYHSMFENCENLIDAPSTLPATNMVQFCYGWMFEGCKKLVNAPLISASSAEYMCCDSMFRGCSSLVSAPALPVKKLGRLCYLNMFNDCSSLKNAPELPATSLADGCYSCMFFDCTSLETAPSLPATTLANHCYWGMFTGCKSLKRAPDLLANTLVSTCYGQMFASCTSLSYIKCLAENITEETAETFTEVWVYNVASNGTFVKSAKCNTWPTGDNGIPEGWIVTDDGQVSVASVSLNKTSLTMISGDTYTLSATISPSNATDKTVTWSSSNPSVATVSSAGVVTAKSAGNATITVTTTDGGKTATCSVTVKAETIPVTGVSLDVTSMFLDPGTSKVLKATVAPSDASDKSVTLSSSDESIVKVTKRTPASGYNVKGIAPGTAVITATTSDGGFTATCSVQVLSYVDLGLPSGTRWAPYNLGATKPEDCGDYYAWGEVETKSIFRRANYKWGYTCVKYCFQEPYMDQIENLELADDAAYVNWGENWRVPSEQDFQELLTYCTMTRETYYGINGVRATSTINGNSVFFPKAGYMSESLYQEGVNSYYWTSNVSTEDNSRAIIYISTKDTVFSRKDNEWRYYGNSIRPVYIKNKTE